MTHKYTNNKKIAIILLTGATIDGKKACKKSWAVKFEYNTRGTL